MAVNFVTSHAGPAQRTQIVDVSTPTRADKNRLQGLGLDLTESGDAESVEVVLVTGDAGRREAARGEVPLPVRIADLDAAGAAEPEARRGYRRPAAKAGGTALPSGRTAYRRLADYELELKQLGAAVSELVRPFTLPYRTHLGRDVMGVEIARTPTT